MSTYLIAYEEALTLIIEKGGSQETVDKAIAEYNAFKLSAFKEWLGKADLKCVHCGAAADKDDAEPLEEIACKDHRRKEKSE